MSDSYLWTSPDGVSVNIKLDVVERMLMEVMRGFGAVPKRGAEVGGILLGAIDSASSMVTIEDFAPVPIEYRRGPSYLLGEDDIRTFDASLAAAGARAIGFFRSHTRDGDGLTAEDTAFCGDRFLHPLSQVLLIRPYAVRVSQAGFIGKRDGRFPLGAPTNEFPFRRRELEPGSGEPSRPRHRERGRRDETREETAGVDPAPDSAAPTQEAVVPESRGDWMLAPLWVTCLLALGCVLGILGTRIVEETSARPAAPFSARGLQMELGANEAAQDITLRWNAASEALRSAERAEVTIEDGDERRVLVLDQPQIKAGRFVYRHASPAVRFRLEVLLSGRTSLAETLDWKH